MKIENPVGHTGLNMAQHMLSRYLPFAYRFSIQSVEEKVDRFKIILLWVGV